MDRKRNIQKKKAKSPVFIQKKDVIPRPICIETAQKTVPIVGVHEKYGLIETYKGCYVKSYLIGDNNYLTAPEEEQNVYYRGWKKVLNSFGSNVEFDLSFNNRSINMTDFFESVLIKETGDEFDHLRKQMNTIIVDRMQDGKNGIQKDKYLTVAVHTDKPKKAGEVFCRLDRDLHKSLVKIGSYAKVIPLEERLEILFALYNDSDEHLLTKSRVIDEDGRTREVKSFDYRNMRSMGLEINDLIAPTSFDIAPEHIQMGNKFSRTLRVTNLPSQLNDEFINSATDMSFNCLTTMNYKAIPTREAEALALRDDMHQKDEHLFETTLTVTIFAESLEQLEEYTETLITEYKKASVVIETMTEQQEEGFNSTLPLCYNQVACKRTLKSSSAAIFVPFSTLELNDPNGINYSCNLLSKNLLVYDRLLSSNFNGFILGTPGAGKSFSAKIEMLSVFLKTNSDIIVIDPEDEYTALAKLLGGEIIKVVPGGENHINPLEIVTDYELEEELNPINAKADFVLKIVECILKSPFGINSVQETIIDECVHELFDPFVVNGKLREISEDEMPTLTDLQILLAKRKEREAYEIAMALKLYTGNGSLNAFGFRTNVRAKKRFVVYQIRDVGERLKNLAMLTILDHIWNRIVENRRIGKNTWFYVDEIYLLFQNEYSATFLNTLFRRARKYGGIPTGITQNVTPLLESPTARDMLQNCCFIQILAQAAPDREQLRGLLNLSEAQIDYITSSPKGQGLLYTGQNVVPFYSQFPKDNDVYKCLTSDLKEIVAFEAQAKREMAKAAKQAQEYADMESMYREHEARKRQEQMEQQMKLMQMYLMLQYMPKQYQGTVTQDRIQEIVRSGIPTFSNFESKVVAEMPAIEGQRVFYLPQNESVQNEFERLMERLGEDETLKKQLQSQKHEKDAMAEGNQRELDKKLNTETMIEESEENTAQMNPEMQKELERRKAMAVKLALREQKRAERKWKWGGRK